MCCISSRSSEYHAYQPQIYLKRNKFVSNLPHSFFRFKLLKTMYHLRHLLRHPLLRHGPPSTIQHKNLFYHYIIQHRHRYLFPTLLPHRPPPRSSRPLTTMRQCRSWHFLSTMSGQTLKQNYVGIRFSSSKIFVSHIL